MKKLLILGTFLFGLAAAAPYPMCEIGHACVSDCDVMKQNCMDLCRDNFERKELSVCLQTCNAWSKDCIECE